MVEGFLDQESYLHDKCRKIAFLGNFSIGEVKKDKACY